MRLSGRNRKGSGHGDNVRVCFGKPREKAWETQVIADGEAQLPYRRSIHQNDAAARRIDVGFAPGFTGRKVDVEQVELVVSRADLAFAVDHEPAVRDLPVLRKHCERAEMEPDMVPTRRVPTRGEYLVFILVAKVRRRSGGIAIEKPRHFRGEQYLRAAFCSLCNRLLEPMNVRARADPGRRLEEGDPGHYAIRSSRPPLRSRSSRSSQPPTWCSRMKICGTVVLPLARWTICSFSSPP